MDNTQDSTLHFLDYWRVIRSRKEIVLAVALLVVLTGTAVTFTLPKIYEASARISIKKDALNVDVFQREYISGYDPFFLRTQYELIKSRPILYKVIEDRNLREKWGKKRNEDGTPLRREDALSILMNSLSVEQFRDTSLIAIKVRREDPEEAAIIANQVAEAYREHRLSMKRSVTKGAIEALENELREQQIKVDQAEEELERIRREQGISILDGGIRTDKLRLQRLEADHSAARINLIVSQARLDQVMSLDSEKLKNAASYIVGDMALEAIRKESIDVEVQLAFLLENYGENHPEVRQFMAMRDELRLKLDQALEGLKIGVQAAFEVAKAKSDAIENELSAERNIDIASEQQKFLPFNKADRNLLIQREILNALRVRVAQEGIELDVPRTPVELVDPAEPPSGHVSPDLFLNILLSLFVGLGAGIGLAYFIEYLDTSVKTVDDVERYLGQTVIGVIPQKVKPLIEEGPNSPHAEAYRVLRTNMQFSGKGTRLGAFAVISGGVGEGKSTTLFNLAYVCAQLGDKVVIVDSDLRRPVLHTMLGMSNRFGLTNVLMKDVPVEEAIKPTSMPNLHFLPSGRLPRTSLGLLDTQRMRELIKTLKTRYDYVFLDSPPIVGVSDASILASEVDGVLLVVQYRKYPRMISSRAKRMVENVGGNVVGVVMNNINIMRDDYYYYYHSSHTHYEQAPESDTVAGTLTPTEVKEDAL